MYNISNLKQLTLTLLLYTCISIVITIRRTYLPIYHMKTELLDRHQLYLPEHPAYRGGCLHHMCHVTLLQMKDKAAINVNVENFFYFFFILKIDIKYLLKPQIYNLVHTTRFWNNLHQGHSQSKNWKAKLLKALGAIKPKDL